MNDACRGDERLGRRTGGVDAGAADICSFNHGNGVTRWNEFSKVGACCLA